MPRRTRAVAALEKAGHPVIRIAVADTYDLGQEFFRWEIATAVAGSIIGINAFNQPDVEASKIETRKLTDRVRKDRLVTAETPILEDKGSQAFHRRQECRRPWQGGRREVAASVSQGLISTA